MNALETMNYVTRKDKVYLVTGKRRHREGEGIYLYPFLTSAVDGGGWSTPRPLFLGEGDSIPIVGER
jgi:hypothetical protein